MQHVNDAIARLQQTVSPQDIDWRKWLMPSDIARVIPAENLAEECKRELMLGVEHGQGLSLPWHKTHQHVLIRPGKLAVWTGWSHHGKSAMLKQAMLYAIKYGEKVLMASMEESPKDLWQDMCVMYCGVSSPTPRVVDEFVENIRGRMWVYDQQGVVDANRMTALVRFAGSELKVSQVVIDSLMMLSMDRDDYDAQSRFMSGLKSATKDTGVTAHLVAHMRKRDGRGDEVMGTLHDISGGHEIGSKADYIFNVWRRKDEKSDDKPSCVLRVEKQRGRKPYNWIGSVGLNYHENSGTFVEGNIPMQYARQAAAVVGAQRG